MAIENLNQGSVNLSMLKDFEYDEWRGLGADWFNAPAVAEEDWKANEQAANNQLIRDLYLSQQQNNFAREQMLQQMSWEERMSNTAYQRVVSDMKKAGINPVMAISQGGSSTPSVSAPSPSASRSSGGYRGPGTSVNTGAFIASILSLVAGIYGAGAKSASTIAAAEIASNAKKYAADTGYIRDVKWRNYYDKKK